MAVAAVGIVRTGAVGIAAVGTLIVGSAMLLRRGAHGRGMLRLLRARGRR